MNVAFVSMPKRDKIWKLATIPYRHPYISTRSPGEGDREVHHSKLSLAALSVRTAIVGLYLWLSTAAT
jgi:hypothetical protein